MYSSTEACFLTTSRESVKFSSMPPSEPLRLQDSITSLHWHLVWLWRQLFTFSRVVQTNSEFSIWQTSPHPLCPRIYSCSRFWESCLHLALDETINTTCCYGLISKTSKFTEYGIISGFKLQTEQCNLFETCCQQPFSNQLALTRLETGKQLA